MSATVNLCERDLADLIARALVASKTSAANAAVVARALAKAEVDGQKGHGLSRVPSYCIQAKASKVDGHATPAARRARPGVLMVDVAHGFSYPAIELALAELPAMAREAGIATAAFQRSHHCGVAGHPVERLAEQGLVALYVGNGPKAMAAWGGKRSLFGTNPLSFAAPISGRPPLVIDMATSQVARGRILTAAQKGEPIPEGWAFDADGKPTTDAKAAMAGTLAPLGGAKGAALALMIEVLAGALVGSHLSFEASSFFDDKGGPPSVGQVLIAIDPAGFAGAETFAGRIGDIVAAIEGDGARLPGTKRLTLRAKAAKSGVDVDAKLLAEVKAIAGLA